LREEHRPRISENRKLKKIFGPKMYVVRRAWRRLHNEESYDSSPSIVLVIKSRRIRWADMWHVWGGEKRCYKVLVGNLKERRHLKSLGVDWRIVSKWIFKRWEGVWTGLIWLRIGRGGELL
jgi:hypothetical protein